MSCPMVPGVLALSATIGGPTSAGGDLANLALPGDATDAGPGIDLWGFLKLLSH